MKTPKLFQLLSLVTLVSLAACSKDDPVAPGADPPADVNGYIADLPSWTAFSPPQADEDVALGDGTDSEEQIGGSPYNCTTTPYSITRTPDRIVTLNPDVEILWVGALLQGKGHLGGIGSLGELPVRQRAPLELSIDLLIGENARTVPNPSVATVTSAIGGLISDAQTAGHTAGSNIFYTKETTHSMTQAALSMGLSANYMGATIKATLSSNISEETRTVTAYFVQRMFNVSMTLPQTPGDVFSDAFTGELLQEQIDRGRIGPDNLPVYISSIAYGRILMFSFTSTASLVDINATLEAMYNSGEFGGSLDAHLQQVLNEAQIEVVTVGGDANQALALIRNNDLDAYFAQDAPLTTARPISYTVRNLADNVIASVAETTNYNLQQCIPVDVPATGAVYTFTLEKLVVADLPYIDGWTLPPNDALDIEILWDINVERIPGGPLQVSKYASTILRPFYGIYREGAEIILPESDPVTNVALHYDGRDFFRMYGTIWDFDNTSASDPLTFSRTIRLSTTPLANAGYASVNATDSSGNKVTVYFSYEKTGTLDD